MTTAGRPRRATFVAVGAAVLIALGLDLFGPGRRVDAWLWDRLSRLAAPSVTDDRTIVFAVDDASIAALQPLVGAWPYRRDVWAHVITYLRAAGASHVTIDVLLADPRDGDQQLRDALQQFPQVGLAAVPVPFQVRADRAPAGPSPRSLRVDAGSPARRAVDLFAPIAMLRDVALLGSTTAAVDDDGVVRRLPVLTRVGDAYLPSLGLWPLLGPDRSVRLDRGWLGDVLAFGTTRVPVDDEGQVELRYPSSPPMLNTRPLADLVRAAVLPASAPNLSDIVRGRQVFIGATALLLEEAVLTPVGRLPGVEFLRLASVLVREGAVVRPRAWPLDVTIFAIALITVVVASRRRPERSMTVLWAMPVAWVVTVGVAVLLLLSFEQRVWLHAPLLVALVAAALLDLGDLARLRRERAAIDAERQAAERASDLKTQFLNHVAHELRTPVTAILGFGRLIVEGRDPSASLEYARVISRNGAHLLQLVNNLLDDATLAAGRARVDLQPVAVRVLVGDVVATIEGLPRHDGVALSGDVASRVPAYLLLDALRVRQVLLNLLANAMKFTEAGSIDLRVDWQDGEVRMTVRDTGPGMSRDVLARVFEDFEVGHPRALRAGGTGLGLSVSRRLARLMGGEITADSTEGVGSTFTLALPARAADAPAAVDTDDDALERPAGGEGPLVLICDDIDDIRQLFAVVLTAAGARVVTASRGREAVTLTARLQPDAILLDLDLPDQDGLTTARQLRADGYEGAVIAISGSGEDREAALRSHGFSDSARKPISSALLIDLVARHVRHWQPRRAQPRPGGSL